MRHGLGPVIRDELAKDINESTKMTTLPLDETRAKQVIKLLFLFAIGERKILLSTRYLNSTFFGHTKAVHLCGKVYDAIELVDT